jgi:hypothetical protein
MDQGKPQETSARITGVPAEVLIHVRRYEAGVYNL